MKMTNDQREAYLLYLNDHQQGCVREDRKYYADEIDNVENGEAPNENEFNAFLESVENNTSVF